MFMFIRTEDDYRQTVSMIAGFVASGLAAGLGPDIETKQRAILAVALAVEIVAQTAQVPIPDWVGR